MSQNECQEMPPGLMQRVAISIIVLFGGLICAIIYVSFFALSFSIFQKIAFIIVVILALIAALGLMWTSYCMKPGMGLCK